MRVLFDTNVLVDAAVADRSHHRDAVLLIDEVERGSLSGVIAPLSLGTIWYLGVEHYETDPRPLIEDLSMVMDLASMGRPVLSNALQYAPDTDFEDVYLAEAGSAAGAGIVATHNPSDFAPTALTAHPPHEILRMLP
jgi:predicted nucleic acid-binding protein